MVELMAVVCIIGILAVVAVPAMRGLTGGGGKKQALAQVMGAIEVARNTALSNMTNAAVIFPDSSSDGVFGGTTNPFRYRSMAVVAWNSTNPNTPPAMAGPWIVLPQGIYFMQKRMDKLDKLPGITVRILTTTRSNITFPAIVFQSDGAISESYPSGTNGVAFHEGTNLPTTQTNFETILLYNYTGKARPVFAPAP